jgi:shikimate kinase
MKYNNTLILIGPCRSGKSTIASIISEKISKSIISLDAVGNRFIREIYNKRDEELYIEYLYTHEYMEWFKLTRKYEVYVVERALSEYENCVIDFGAGHSVYDDKKDIIKISNILKPYKNIFLLFPSPDIEKSLEILLNRYEEPLHIGTAEHLIRHKLYFQLSKYQIFTENKAPEETAKEILLIYNKNN